MNTTTSQATAPLPRQRIAVIGSGISGMAAAYYLSRHHEVHVFESAERLGGHTATMDVQTADGSEWAIDTGFIVFNDRTYPHFQRLLERLDVAYQPTEMSFSVHTTAEDFEYNGHTLLSLFAQKRNLLRPRFYRLLRDILRFNQQAAADLDSGRLAEDATLGSYLDANDYSQVFREHYLLPMGAAIWSASIADIERFPLQFFVRFFRHHGLLSINDRPQWFTLIGGSRSYIAPLTEGYAERIHLNSEIRQIRRDVDGVTLEHVDGRCERFDQVVLACHAPQALALLKDASAREQDVLSVITTQRNDVVMHTDTSLLPRRREAWASWNYRLDGRDDAQRASVTYDMNILQRLDERDYPPRETFCITLNDSDAIDPALVLGRYAYDHPRFTLEAEAAKQRFMEISGVSPRPGGPVGRTHFCGAWWRNGFHEDGVWSALRVAEALGAREADD
ncbi:FAD-dependent oxidoreductase [Cobetia sp. 3AK]|uniref:NAD(P)/FAD-dependent oxidoreductase n=1 Tax=Cobetia sp. 3AK TaxID=3040020 RepID=UPI002448DD37|nr:FAD-dependent oxidoreductase [Cobetia sp. 3AK]MDH2375189.1 FAD-dependent oxidoreductase [Cobetia sp. 3AK]